MDALRDQHAAAVAREGAASRLVVIALRPPQPDDRRTADDGAELAGAQDLGEPHARRAEAMLEHDAEGDARVAARPDELLGLLGRGLDRLFEQHMLAGRGASAGDVEMGVRRREDRYCVDRCVVEDRVEAVAERKVEPRAERLAPRRARAEGVGDLDLVGEVDEAFGVRRDRHAQSDDGNAFRHLAFRLVFVRVRTTAAVRGSEPARR